MRLLLLLCYLFFTTVGMILMKLGGDSISLAVKGGIAFKIGFLTLMGFILYALSFILWQKLLITFDLSKIVPITTGIMQIVILIVGYYIFHEKISLHHIFGVIFIIAGIVLISFVGNK